MYLNEFSVVFQLMVFNELRKIKSVGKIGREDTKLLLYSMQSRF
jgi:hypothetical protein